MNEDSISGIYDTLKDCSKHPPQTPGGDLWRRYIQVIYMGVPLPDHVPGNVTSVPSRLYTAVTNAYGASHSINKLHKLGIPAIGKPIPKQRRNLRVAASAYANTDPQYELSGDTQVGSVPFFFQHFTGAMSFNPFKLEVKLL